MNSSPAITIPLYQIDAFTDQALKGNPAAVMPLKDWLPDATLQALAAENNLSETAFIVPQGEDYAIRWFTPTQEVPLCGHATLAAGHVVLTYLYPGRESVTFHSRERGPLPVSRDDAGRLCLDFPITPLRRMVMPDKLEALLGAQILEGQGYLSGEYLVVLPSSQDVRSITPLLQHFDKVKAKAVIVTAEASADDDCDFVCRYFAPGLGVGEDPVTGSIHTALVPFWAKRLGKETLRSRQVSARGGILYCHLQGDRVQIAGDSVLYLRGEVTLAAQLLSA
jgi:PhzF family phenazine biosynthesis protein